MNSEIYVLIAEYLWSDEISSLFALCKDDSDIIDFKTYLAARIITRSISYYWQYKYEDRLYKLNYQYDSEDDYYWNRWDKMDYRDRW